jgi:tetratricopeptide (TPR) repeat protein
VDDGQSFNFYSKNAQKFFSYSAFVFFRNQKGLDSIRFYRFTSNNNVTKYRHTQQSTINNTVRGTDKIFHHIQHQVITMSRQNWFKRGELSGQEFNDAVGLREKLSEKTDDPEAKDFDEAVELFCRGLKLAPLGGDLDLAASQIACAFLLNSRSITFIPKIPDNPVDQKNKHLILDLDLLFSLMAATSATSKYEDSYACSVLRIMTGQFLGKLEKIGQTLIAEGMTAIERLLGLIADDPSIENPDRSIIGGCLTRTNLLFHRSSLHMAMGNRKNAMKDLTNALKIDEFFTKARESRGYLWASFNLKDDRTIHIEFTRVANEFHRDNRGMEGVYAWLAITTLNDPSIGSVEDAKAYFDKCLKAAIRRDELYGPQRRIDELPACVQRAHGLFQQLPTAIHNQRNLHDIIQGMRVISVDKYEEEIRKNKYVCVKCGADRKPDGGMVMQCIRCRSASYCSAECQKAVSSFHQSQVPFFFLLFNKLTTFYPSFACTFDANKTYNL